MGWKVPYGIMGKMSLGQDKKSLFDTVALWGDNWSFSSPRVHGFRASLLITKTKRNALRGNEKRGPQQNGREYVQWEEGKGLNTEERRGRGRGGIRPSKQNFGLSLTACPTTATQMSSTKRELVPRRPTLFCPN
jgi:hypothetical protein